MKKKIVQRRVLISGEVQGVGFRAATVREARKYPTLSGWVRNLPDGRVEAVFSGPEPDVLALSTCCGHGPSTAQVSQIEIQEEDPDPTLAGFQVAHFNKLT